LIIRRGAAADTEVATQIYLVSRTAAGPAFPPNIHSDDETLEFVREVVMATREPWLAIVDDTPVGLLVLDGDDIDWLHVLPEAQGQGVGSALLGHAQSLRPNGLALWTYTSNTPAQRFYERHGFVIVRETDGAGNEDHAPDIRYAWGDHRERREQIETL
jgi:ribosomal protein S18 acetylase RimI-like enzyme